MLQIPHWVFPKFASSFFFLFQNSKLKKKWSKSSFLHLTFPRGCWGRSQEPIEFHLFLVVSEAGVGRKGVAVFLTPLQGLSGHICNKRQSDNRKCMIYSLNWSFTWHRRLQKWRFKDLGKLFLLLLFSLDGKWTTWPKCDWIKAWTIGSMLMGEKPGKLSLLRFILTSLWSTLFSCGKGLLCNERLGGRREGVTFIAV